MEKIFILKHHLNDDIVRFGWPEIRNQKNYNAPYRVYYLRCGVLNLSCTIYYLGKAVISDETHASESPGIFESVQLPGPRINLLFFYYVKIWYSSRICIFNKILRWFLSIVKFENHLSMRESWLMHFNLINPGM